jgi:hypothetical protein
MSEESVSVGVYIGFKLQRRSNIGKTRGDEVKFFGILYNDSFVLRVTFLSQPSNEIVIKTF